MIGVHIFESECSSGTENVDIQSSKLVARPNGKFYSTNSVLPTYLKDQLMVPRRLIFTSIVLVLFFFNAG